MNKYNLIPTPMHSLLCISLATCLLTITDRVSAQSLSYHYNQALQNDANYEATVKRHQATRELEDITSSVLWPTLSFTANKTQITGDVKAPDIDTSTQSLTLSYNIRAEIIPSRNGAQAAVKQSRSNLNNTQQLLMVSTIDNYFTVVKNQISINSLRTQKKSVEQSLAKISKQLELGLVNSVAVTEVENNLQQLNLNLLRAQQTLYQSQTKLAISTGQPVDQILVGIGYDTDIPELPNTDIEYWWDVALLNSPMLQGQQQGVAKAYYDYKKISAQHFPRFGINATLDNNSKKTVSMSISSDLFAGGLTSSQSQQAQYNWQASQAGLRSSSTALRQKIANLLYSLRNNQEQISLHQSLLASSQISLEATEAKYKLGLKELVDVLTAQQVVAKHAVNLESSRYDQLILQANTKQAAGVLNAKDLQELDALLD